MHKSTGSNHPSGMPECIMELEILFYGKNIAQYEVTASSSITITNIKNRTPIIYLLPSTLKMLAAKILFSFKKIIRLHT
jgi:hypothetical protein